MRSLGRKDNDGEPKMDLIIGVLHVVILLITWLFAVAGWASVGVVVAMMQSRSRPIIVKHGTIGFVVGAVVTTLALMRL